MINLTPEEAEQIKLYGHKKRTDIPAIYMDFRYPIRKNHGAGLWQVSGIMEGSIRQYLLPHLPDIMEKIRDPKSRAGRGDNFNHTHLVTQLLRHSTKDLRNIKLMSEADTCQVLINTPL